jgi:predicted permease
VDIGFNAQHLATVDVAAEDQMVATNGKAMELYREIYRRVSALPGVQAVAITSDLPVQCNCDTDWIRFEGRPFHGEHNEVLERDVSPEYLAAMQARLVSGRMLAPTDDASHPQVIVINEALAKKYYPGQNPIGQRIGNGELAPDSMRQIVGVVADVREEGLDQEVWPAEYQSLYRSTNGNFSVAVRTTQDEKSILPELVSTLRGISPNLGVYNEQSMQQRINSTGAAVIHRFSTWLVGGFAVLALVLGVVGLYGVIAYSVSQRTREIGVRMALGAQRRAVYSMVMKQAGWLTVIGLGLGIVCSIGASLSMRKLLFGVVAWDVSTLAAVAGVLGLASMMASFIPARRAASVNPSDALRAE